MTSSIVEKFRTFDQKVLSQFVPWHVNTWNRPGR